MTDKFLITNYTNEIPAIIKDLSLIRHNHGIKVYSKLNYFEFDNIIILIDGFVVPRNKIFNQYKQFEQYELVYRLYKKYGEIFASYIKGFFCIAIIDNDIALLVNDIHSVKRCYIGHKEESTFISNDLKSLSSFINFNFNKNAPIIQATLQHFVKGMTLFDNISYSEPSSIITLNSHNFVNRKYFSPSDLIKLDRSQTNRKDFIEIFKNSISNYIEYLNPKLISTTLTGGRDTRTILSVLINLGIEPHCFTFGLPTGTDVNTAKIVSNKCGLSFSNHYIEDLNSKTYGSLVNEIISLGKPHINLHRAHRLDAIQKENMIANGNLEMVFVGAMGGDYIMGEHFNDYILTEFLRRFLTENTSERIIISDILNKHSVRFDNNTIDFIIAYLESVELYHNKFNKNVEFNLVHNIIGCSHDIQDIDLFLEQSKYVIAPFMDIDIIEALFSSQMSLFSNTRHTKNPFKRLIGGELQCQIIKQFAPKLANVPFANLYTPNDVLGNRYLYILKRIYLQSTKAPTNPTFRYDFWFQDFINEHLTSNEEFISQFYNYNILKEDFKMLNHKSIEGYWHKYTNPINLSLYLNNLK
ncbi:MAG: hypothetical protein Q7U54_12405 [Bacteroidales bacterium]|nr:hypothetical protein [Bacteroidales bacterium]